MQTSEYLRTKATEVRALMLKMANAAKTEGAHIGPALSLADIVTVLFFDAMRLKPEEPWWPERDRFILSKGHGVLALYAPLALKGFYPLEETESFAGLNTRLAGHPSSLELGGLEHPAGSLGHGLSVGCGMALAGKKDKKNYRVYIVLGDGETNEGSVWEAVMFARQHRLDNLVAVVDKNGFQYGGTTKELMDLEPMEEKWRAFGWNVIVVDGHDVEELQAAFAKAEREKGVPTCILAKTVKGKGVSFMENNNDWHHASVNDEIYKKALGELNREG